MTPGEALPEARLLAAVLVQACVDAGLISHTRPRGVSETIRADAQRWLRGEDGAAFCEWLDLDHAKIIEALDAQERARWDERSMVQLDFLAALEAP